uniref:Engulfment and cell motility 3 n=1 Tax=Poecilia reticulata TaxID=8081 RepID=A0A3P9MW45_POERE
MPQQKDIVRIAIQMPGALPQLIQLDQKKPLSAVIKEVCDGWNLPGPDNYALQYDGVQMYITESNRLDIKNGCILRLTKAPGRCADDLHRGIQSSDGGVRCDSLKELASVSRDVTFAQEFINLDGHNLLVKIVEESRESNQIMTHTLTGFTELMDHGIVSWENLSAIFIKKIAGFVNSSSTDVSMQQVSLDILENMVLSSRQLFLQVKQEVTMERLVAHLQVANQQIQTKAMALLMALLQTAEDADRQEMFAFLNKKNVRQYIYKDIILSSSPVQDEMAHHLYVLQSVTLNHLETRMRTPLDCYSQEQRDALHGLRQAAFETDSENSLSHERRRSLCAKEFKKLGFSNNSNPGQDLVRTPPGLLALDTMFYFATRYPDAYSRFVLENSSREDKHECPFARSSIQLTLILCEILRIGDPPSETGSSFHPIFFSQDRLLEELFCVCIQLLNKTWKEMRATQEDFDKVMQVVKEQITRTLASKPTSLELFKNKVNALNYSEILKLRQTERLHQEETLAPPVLQTVVLPPVAQPQDAALRRRGGRRREPGHRDAAGQDPSGRYQRFADREGLSSHEGEQGQADQGSPGFGLQHHLRCGGVQPELHRPLQDRLLPVDGRTERPAGPGHEQRVDAQRAGDPAVHGDQAPPPGPGERPHPRRRPRRAQTAQQLQLLLRLQPDGAVGQLWAGSGSGRGPARPSRLLFLSDRFQLFTEGGSVEPIQIFLQNQF